MKRIPVAVDGSDASLRAVDLAAGNVMAEQVPLDPTLREFARC